MRHDVVSDRQGGVVASARRWPRPRLLAGIAVAAIVGVSGCSVNVGAGTRDLPADRLETEVADTLETELGWRPDAVDCADPLPAEVGAEVRCVLDDGPVKIGATVTATEVRNGRIAFDIVTDDEPMEPGAA